MTTWRDTYAAGKRFRVVREGATLNGMVQTGTVIRAWSRPLVVGEVIVSRGPGYGWGSDPGFGVHWETDEPDVEHAYVTPSGSPMFFIYYPADGFLEEVT